MSDDKTKDTDTTSDAATGPDDASAKAVVSPPDKTITTAHSIRVGRSAVSYAATTGTFTLKDRAGKAKCTMGFTSYVRSDTDPTTRPVMFAFNGGPGSSSVWLHLGMLGPRRVRIGDHTDGFAPPYELIDNEHTVLDAVDLVFIDPVSTGYSRPVEGEEAKAFHGVKEDAEWVAEFIRLWTTRNGRWASPKFLAGESYGAIRGASVASRLQERHGLELNGILFVAGLLWYQTLSFLPGNDLGSVLFLPSFAAAARYHGRLDDVWPDVRSLTDEVEAFALGQYATVLLQGSRASDADRAAVLDGLERYTGLERELLERSDLRLSTPRIMKELLRDQRRIVGRLDSRFTGIDADPAGGGVQADPAMSTVRGAYATVMNDYLRNELGFESDEIYEWFDPETGGQWNYGNEGSNRYVDVGRPLRQTMDANAELLVFIASGYYDLAAPYLAMEWTFDHLGLVAGRLENVTSKRYEAGHMMYVHEPSLAELRSDLAEWLAKAVAATPATSRRATKPAPAGPSTRSKAARKSRAR